MNRRIAAAQKAKQQGVTLLQSGQFEQARAVLQQAAERARRDPDLWFLLSAANGQLGRLEDTATCCRRVLALVPDHPGALSNLGNALSALGHHEDALTQYRKALKSTPNDPGLHNNLGRTLFMLERKAEAEEHFRRSLALNPNNVEATYNLASHVEQSGNRQEAVDLYQRALALRPDMADAWVRLGNLLRLEGHLQQSADAYGRALALAPTHGDALFGLAFLHNERGAQEWAVDCLHRLLEAEPGSVRAQCLLGRVHVDRGEYPLALAAYGKAQELDPHNAEAVGGLADTHEHQGNTEAAYRIVRDALDKGQKDMLLAIVLTRLCKRFGCCEEAVALVDELLARPDLEDGPRRTLHFASGHLYDRLGDFDRAFGHFRQANELCRYGFDRSGHSVRVDALIDVFQGARIRDLPRSRVDSELPVFIVGMPRSGTSLVEQILASHPSVAGGGERNDLNRLVLQWQTDLDKGISYPEGLTRTAPAALDEAAQTYLDQLRKLDPHARRITDKMPANFMHAGLIALLFPGARIIHCLRDPRDTCLSIYFQHFSGSHPYANDLEDLGHYYREYRRLMAHWEAVLDIPMMTVRYEELVEDQERVSRDMVSFCGLDWDPRCLEFHRTERSVSTASYDQVRKPIYRRSVQRWRQYERHIRPLLSALADF